MALLVDIRSKFLSRWSSLPSCSILVSTLTTAKISGCSSSSFSWFERLVVLDLPTANNTLSLFCSYHSFPSSQIFVPCATAVSQSLKAPAMKCLLFSSANVSRRKSTSLQTVPFPVLLPDTHSNFPCFWWPAPSICNRLHVASTIEAGGQFFWGLLPAHFPPTYASLQSIRLLIFDSKGILQAV